MPKAAAPLTRPFHAHSHEQAGKPVVDVIRNAVVDKNANNNVERQDYGVLIW